MKEKQKPEKLPNLFETIKECIDKGNYILTTHALDNQDKRDITLPAVLYVLKNGRHEKQKTTFDAVNNSWKYAIRAKTLNDLDIRIIVSFNEDKMIIITVMLVGKL